MQTKGEDAVSGAVGMHRLHANINQSTESNMNWDRIEGNWKQLKGRVMQKWGMLIDDPIEIAVGRSVQLSGRIQESYGVSRDEAGKLLAARQVSQK